MSENNSKKEKEEKNARKQKSRAQGLFAVILIALLATIGLAVYLHSSPQIAANQTETTDPSTSTENSDQEETPSGTLTTTIPVTPTLTTVVTPTLTPDPVKNPNGNDSIVTDNLTKNHQEDLAWLKDWAKSPWKYLDWLLAALAGTLLYALVNISYYYRSSFPNGEYKRSSRSGDFIQFTPWYISTVVKGPIIAVAIMLFLTNVDIEISGISINFSQLAPSVLIFMAFILGFYSRVAREQLDQIVKTVFRKAYSAAEERFSVRPRLVVLGKGGNQTFKTSPPYEVTWIKDGLGDISANGLFTAPDSDDIDGKQTQIIAIPKDDNLPRQTATVVFRVGKLGVTSADLEKEGDEYQVAYGKEKRINFETVPGGAHVKWQVSEGSPGSFSEEPANEFVLPEVTEKTEISIEAKPQHATSKLTAADPFKFFVLPPSAEDGEEVELEEEKPIEPADPEDEVPADPEVEVPADPEVEVPADPEDEVPADPEGEVPVDPEGEVPVDPEGEVPADPEGEAPADPDGEVPANPDGETPVDPTENVEGGS